MVSFFSLGLGVLGGAVWFFLPSWIGNSAPVILARYGRLKWLNIPVDGGVMLGGQRLLGATKTWRGIVGGAAFGAATGLLQFCFFWGFTFLFLTNASVPAETIIPEGVLVEFPWFLYGSWQTAALLGFLLGLGEGLGDVAKSFIKRRLNVGSSAACFPLDQTSFLGALALGAFVYFPPWEHVAVIIVLSLIIPVIANRVAYKWGWKKVPW